MKKILALVLVVLMVLTVLVSCGSKAGSIEGYWKGEVDGESAIMYFGDDGNGKVYTVSDEGSYYIDFEWKAADGKLTLTLMGESEDAEYSLSGDTLTLDGEDLTRASKSDVPEDAIDIMAMMSALGADSE